MYIECLKSDGKEERVRQLLCTLAIIRSIIIVHVMPLKWHMVLGDYTSRTPRKWRQHEKC